MSEKSRVHLFQRDLLLFWVSCLTLFLEILMIRWLSAEVRIFSYFHNLVLLFCFLGIGLGCALSNRSTNLLVSCVLMFLLVLLLRLDSYMGVFSIKNISSYLSLGSDFLIWYMPILKKWYIDFGYLVLGMGMLLFCTVLLTVFFIPFGQMIGKLIDEHSHPLRAYGINILGSLAGIWLFFGVSFLSLPPVFWFALGGAGMVVMMLNNKKRASIAAILTVLSISLLYEKQTFPWLTRWSPYQKLTVRPLNAIASGKKVQSGYWVYVNSVGYMTMTNYSPQFKHKHPELFPPEIIPYDHYNIPYRFKKNPGHVLVVGSGAGNDIAGALRNGAKQVTAVDIDPVIIQIGRRLHPEAPYSSPRVKVVNDDARSFFKRTKNKYDLIVFGLLDAHTLSSSYSNVRLDNYVYTLGSLREVKRLLKPEGLLVLTFATMDDFIWARLQKMLHLTFGKPPVGFLPPRSPLRSWMDYGFVAGNTRVLEKSISRDDRLKQIVEESKPELENLSRLKVPLTTDDWPYLYLTGRTIPKLYFLIFCALILCFQIGIKKVVGTKYAIQWHFFFLGAGFLLLEVQNISKFALLFGSTWTVNAVVISAILVMILFSNYAAMKWRVTSLKPYYMGLFAALLGNFIVPYEAFSGMAFFAKGIAAGTVMALPVFFAGIIFSTLFSKAEDRAGAFASNLFGAMVGGMLECLSFVVGIKALLVVAAALYVCAMAMEKHIAMQKAI